MRKSFVGYFLHILIIITGSLLSSNCFAKITVGGKSHTVDCISVRKNLFLLRGNELCPQSLMAINTQLSPTGDILVWCANAPDNKTKASVSNLGTKEASP